MPGLEGGVKDDLFSSGKGGSKLDIVVRLGGRLHFGISMLGISRLGQV